MMRILFAGVTLFFATALSAQDFYFNPVAGYGLNAPGEVSVMGDTATASIDNVNLGGGLNVGVSGGVMFEDYFGIEARLNYQNNFGYETVSLNSYPDPNTGQTMVAPATVSYHASSIRLAPLLFFRMDESVAPYAKVGPVVQYSLLAMESEATNTSFGPNPSVQTTISETTFKNNISIGALGEAGVMFELDGDVFLNAGIAFTSMQVTPSSSEVTRYEVNGQDRLDDLSTNARETEYVESLDLNSSNDPDQPSQALKTWFNYSSFSLRVGVVFML